MLTRNFYNLQAALTLGIQSTDTATFGDGHINAKDYNGTIRLIQPSPDGAMQTFFYGFGWSVSTSINGHTSSFSTGGILSFGTGTTAETFEDYKLETIITAGLSKATFTHGAPAYNAETKKWTNTLSCVVTNTSGSPITINEIGVYVPVAYSSTSAGYGTLVSREVLTTPITIAAGTSVTYTQNLGYTMPTVA